MRHLPSLNKKAYLKVLKGLSTPYYFVLFYFALLCFVFLSISFPYYHQSSKYNKVKELEELLNS